MGKKKKGGNSLQALADKIHPRGINARDRKTFELRRRSTSCLQYPAKKFAHVTRIDPNRIKHILTSKCRSIEHQIYYLRWLIVDPSDDNFKQRKEFTRYLLDCLYDHHGVAYQGILFGSSVNGLGFIDSDIDLRLRPLTRISQDELEPVAYDQDMVERILRNIAFQTTRCSPAIGEFVPSSRCPIAKLTFINGDRQNLKSLEEGWKYDISLSTSSPLGSLNSHYMRFLCHLEPKFHYLATVIRYWAKMHNLIQSGYLSSYALINMLIFYCQNVEPPLLPTVNEMRDKYLSANDRRLKKERKLKSDNDSGTCSVITTAMTQLEWQCLLILDRSAYRESKNTEPLSLLLLKFFEFYLKFPFSRNIITTRTGRPIPFSEFPRSPQFHRRFPLKDYINIQDPFDLRHNTTSGMTGKHFMLLMLTMRCSYERLACEINDNFKVPRKIRQGSSLGKNELNLLHWGLNSIFTPLTAEEKMGFF